MKCFLFALAALTVSPALAQAPQPFYCLGLSRRDVIKSCGPGIVGQRGPALRRSERWFGMKEPAVTEYVFDSASTVREMRARFPRATALRSVVRAAAKELGPAVSGGPNRGTCWIAGGVEYRIARSGGRPVATMRLARLGRRLTRLLPEGVCLLNQVSGRVTGGRNADVVQLIGRRHGPGSLCMDRLWIAFPGRVTGPLAKPRPLAISGLMDASLTLADVNGDGTPDALVTVPTGGSGNVSQYALYTFRDARPRRLPGIQALNRGLNLTVDFEPGFLVRVGGARLRRPFAVRVGRFAREYIEDGIYTQAGGLKCPLSGWVDPPSLVTVERGRSGATLVSHQMISGAYHANTVAECITAWRWQRGRLRPTRATVE